ncbi:MAG TPA: phosphatase PAP2 family protein [Rhizobacter sp.]|nr:phosphatase PAP2 family protein [Rhizobacter sp.]
MSSHPPLRRLVVVTLWLLPVLIAWDASGLDMALAHAFGGPQGFPLTENWWLTEVLHDGGRRASWLVAVLLTLAVWWPVGPLRRLDTPERVQLIGVALLSVLSISLLKAASPTSCPWDLAEFGGTARHVSHWAWLHDGGSGRCFPAGHASSGFAFVGGFFVWRRRAPRIAALWLAAAVVVGFGLGLAQQVRGAHFMSHTLWTGWLCWSLALGLELLLWRLSPDRVRPELPPPAPARRPARAARVPRLRGWLTRGSGSSSTSR